MRENCDFSLLILYLLCFGNPMNLLSSFNYTASIDKLYGILSRIKLLLFLRSARIRDDKLY